MDNSLQVHLHKRKASNDESRYKNPSRLSQNVNIVAPFLDQSFEFGPGIGALASGPQTQIQKSVMLKDKTNITNNQDINRPKTSTGLRPNGTYQKITDDQPATNQSLTNMQSIPTTLNSTNLPTKNPVSKNQASFSGKIEKTDHLR